MLRYVAAAACLVVSTQADARRGVDDSGQCVNPCRLDGGEPCAPCPPPNNIDPTLLQSLRDYQAEVETYRVEVAAHAETNPEFRESNRYRNATEFVSRSREWVAVMRDYARENRER